MKNCIDYIKSKVTNSAIVEIKFERKFDCSIYFSKDSEEFYIKTYCTARVRTETQLYVNSFDSINRINKFLNINEAKWKNNVIEICDISDFCDLTLILENGLIIDTINDIDGTIILLYKDSKKEIKIFFDDKYHLSCQEKYL